MKIGELAKATGTQTETIRYYERENLLPIAMRTESNYRVYDSSHVERLAFIRHCRALDMPLADVQRLLDFTHSDDNACPEINALIDAQLARVHARLLSMQALEKQLAALRRRCQHATDGPCGILHELVAAAHGEACACHPAPPEAA